MIRMKCGHIPIYCVKYCVGEKQYLQRKPHETEEFCDGKVFTRYNGYSQGI
jgi:hypothetical protein